MQEPLDECPSIAIQAIPSRSRLRPPARAPNALKCEKSR